MLSIVATRLSVAKRSGAKVVRVRQLPLKVSISEISLKSSGVITSEDVCI